jgi:pyroglutamyl-peptidase
MTREPDYVICCGMVASRINLGVEVRASIIFGHTTDLTFIDCAENILQTTVDVEQLVAETAAVEIRYDCGGFVCEGLYYSVLDYLYQSQLPIPWIFVHFPTLNQENL